MSRRDKKLPFSGSALLGAELRRLRGSRTLDDIATITKSPPLEGTVPSIGTSTLSEIEAGRQMPRLMTLYTLSMVYRVSMNQLMGFVVEDGIARAAGAVGDEADHEATFARLLSIGEWHRALPIAIHCERLAKSESARLAWRGRRATCLANVGLHGEAVNMLTSCIESVGVSRRQEFMMLQHLADMHAAAGNFKLAMGLVRDALERQPADAPAREVANLESTRANLMIDVEEAAAPADERTVREALRLTERAEKGAPDDVAFRLGQRCTRARAHRLLGNRTVAIRDLDAILREAADLRYTAMEGHAAFQLARLQRETGDEARAESLLQRAKAAGETSQQLAVVFASSLELFHLLRHDRPGAAVAHFRRCREIAPLLPPGCPTVQAFDRLARELAS